MDAAHLAQTFYLVCAELGLGAFVTAAVNGANIEERLGLDPFTEGALAMCGCGRPAAREELDAKFEPYVPRETII
jgi:nitroreductase